MNDDWDGIAEWYTSLVRNGSPMHQFARDILLSVLPPDLSGINVLDVGCGEGLITRAVAVRGAVAVGVDPTRALIEHAQAAEQAQPVGATYRRDDGATLSSVTDATMEWVTAGLSLNNVPDLGAAVGSIARVLKPGGRLAFTVPHPCFDAPRSESVRIEGTVRRVVGDYLAEGFWRTANPQSVRRAGNHHRTISTYLTALLAHGFVVEVVAEPAPNDLVHLGNPHRAGLPPFLLIRAGLAELAAERDRRRGRPIAPEPAQQSRQLPR
jgi:ubiquinone/menaquinone biosynthesis C-methylase UbiE